MKPLDAMALPLAGTTLIEASAGTGKTYTITTLYLRLLLERRLDVDRVLVVTFTNAATAELRTRLRARLREAVHAFERGGSDDAEIATLVRKSADRGADHLRLLAALNDFDQAAVFTIHGFCQRVLSQLAFESGTRTDLELVSDTTALVYQVVQDYLARELHAATPAQLGALKTRGVDVRSLANLARVVSAAPDLHVETDAEGLDCDGALATYAAARSRALKAWPSCRADVGTLLHSNALSRNQYRHESVEHWLAKMDALLAREEPDLGGWFQDVERFTPAKLEAATKKGQSTPQHPFFAECEALVAAHTVAARALDGWVGEFQLGLVRWVRSQLDRCKLDAGQQSFDDLLTRLDAALAAAGGDALSSLLRARYPAALIDEFQDTDPIQYRIFRRVYSGDGASLFLIGDPKQAIYAFRGADVFAYLEAAARAGDARYSLTTNHRSDPSMVTGVNTLFSRLERPFELENIEFVPVTAARSADALSPGPSALELALVTREGDGDALMTKKSVKAPLPSRVASHLVALLAGHSRLNGRPLTPGDVAVLTRTNAEAIEIQAALRERGVPAVLLGDHSVLSASEAVEMAHLLRMLADPTDEGALRRALITSLFGLDANALWQLRDDQVAWEGWLERVRRWHHAWVEGGFMRAFRTLLKETAATARVLELVDGERRLTNLLHLSELLHAAAVEQHLGIAGLMRWYDEVRMDSEKRADLAPEAQQMRLESDDLAVKLTTMHKSKGLEYPIVLCPSLWDGATLRGDDDKHLKFHDPMRGGQRVLRIVGARGQAEKDADPHHALALREAAAENLRLCYVALTRAKHHTSCVFGPFKQVGESSLGRLLLTSSDAGDATTAAQRAATLDDAGLRRWLAGIARSSKESIGVVELSEELADRYTPPTAEVRLRGARAATRKPSSSFRSSSFSALVRGAEHGLSAPAAEGRDRDEQTLEFATPVDESERGSAVALEAFPRGARPGEALHRILELIDFQGDRTALEQVTRATLAAAGFDVERWTEPVVLALSDVLATPLPGAESLRLSDVSRARRRSEMEFVFPVVPAHEALTAARFADVFRRHPSSAVPSDYVDAVARLDFAPLTGFLRGFIDLVFEHEGRFFVVDYKSNHLGRTAADYTAERMAPVMSRHHYFLQYHLYSVALHRHLAVRRSGYDPEQHFGGVLYLFLRGMAPSHGRAGVYFDRPRPALLEDLSRAVGELGAGSA